MSEQGAARAVLVYEGVTIRDRGKMLSMTDAWRAGGADPSKQPSNWRALPNTRAFCAQIASEVVPGKSGDSLFETVRGANAATWAHYKIVTAYAEYLSPAFHSWCIDVVWDYMEGTLPATPTPPVAQAITPADFLAAFDAFGRGFRGDVSDVVAAVVEPLNGRLGKVESGLDDNRAEVAVLRLDVASILALVRDNAGNQRKDFSDATKRELLRAAHAAGGLCPCCKLNRVTNPDGTKALHAEFHHIGKRSDNSPDNGVPLCKDCHKKFTAKPAVMQAEFHEELTAFHKFRRRLPGAQQDLLCVLSR